MRALVFQVGGPAMPYLISKIDVINQHYAFILTLSNLLIICKVFICL